jgi:hypothetical protein
MSDQKVKGAFLDVLMNNPSDVAGTPELVRTGTDPG